MGTNFPLPYGHSFATLACDFMSKRKGADSKQRKFRPAEIRRFLRACYAGDVVAVKQGLAGGHDPNAHDDTLGDRPLHEAAKGGSIPVARLLIAAGADVNARQGYGGVSRPLDLACDKEHVEMAKLLVSAGAATMIDGTSTALQAAARKGNIPILDFLIANGAKPSLDALKAGVRSGEVAIVERLIHAGPASIRRYLRTEVSLVKSASSLENGPAMIRLLAKYGANLCTRSPDRQQVPLHFVNNEEVALFLIENGSDIHAQCSSGLTPLHRCASQGFVHACRLLLQRGADPKFRSRLGKHPLDVVQDYAASGLIEPKVEKALVEMLTEAMKRTCPPKPQTQTQSHKRPAAVVNRRQSTGVKKPATSFVLPKVSVKQAGAADFLEMLEDYPPEFSLMAILADFEKVVRTGKNLWSKKGWHLNVAIESAKENDASFSTLTRLKIANNPWTVVVGSLWADYAVSEIEKWAQVLSSVISSRIITFCRADTAGVYGISIYDCGRLTEQASWMAGQFHSFTSSLRKKPRIPKAGDEAFADQFFREQGIYLPACYPCEKGTRTLALAVHGTSKGSILRADLLEPGCD